LAVRWRRKQEDGEHFSKLQRMRFLMHVRRSGEMKLYRNVFPKIWRLYVVKE